MVGRRLLGLWTGRFQRQAGACLAGQSQTLVCNFLPLCGVPSRSMYCTNKLCCPCFIALPLSGAILARGTVVLAYTSIILQHFRSPIGLLRPVTPLGLPRG